MNTDFLVRPYRNTDRAQLRQIAYETSFLEKPRLFCDDVDIVADVLTMYFTDYEPHSVWVVEREGAVCGYLTGTPNAAQMDRFMNSTIFPKLIWKSVRRGLFLRKSTWLFVWHSWLAMLKGEFRRPTFTDKYPALLHINLLPAVRGVGAGSRLIGAFEAYLKSQGISGMQCATMSVSAKIFFEHNGFHVLLQRQRTYLQYAFGFSVEVFVMGKLILM